MPLTRPFVLGLLCFTFSALAFDEVGDILVTGVQTNASANSTIKCDRTLPIQISHLAYIRTGTNVVVGRYAATYDSTKNVTAAPAASGDGSNSTFDDLTLEVHNGSALVLTLTDKDGGSVCVYDVRVLEGSVMGLKWADGVPHAKDPPPKKSEDKPPVTDTPKDEGSEDGSAGDGGDPQGDQQDDSGEGGDQPADDTQGEEEQEQPVKPVKKGGKGKGKGDTKKRDEEEDTDTDTGTTTDEGAGGEQEEQEQKPVKKPPVTKGGAGHGTKGGHKGDGDGGDEPAPTTAAPKKGAPGQNAKGKGNGGGDPHGLRARATGKGGAAHTRAKPKPKPKVEDEETESDDEVRRGLAQAGGKKGQGQSKGKPSGEGDGTAVEDVVDDAPQPKPKPKPKQGKDDKPKQHDALTAEQKREERVYANAKLYEAGVLQVSVLNTTRSSPGAVCNGNSSGSSQQLWVGQLMAFARFELPEGVRSRLDEDQGGWEGNQPKGLWPSVSEPRRHDLAAAADNPDKEAVELDVRVDSGMALRMRTRRDGDKASGLDGVNWNDVGVRERKGGRGAEEGTITPAHWEDVPVPIVQTPDGHLEPLTTTNEVDPGQPSPPQVNWAAETSVIFGQGATNVRKNELSASIAQSPVGWHLWKLPDGLFVSTERVKQGNTDGSDVPGGCIFAVNVVNGTVFDIQAPNAQPPTAPAHAARFLRSS